MTVQKDRRRIWRGHMTTTTGAAALKQQLLVDPTEAARLLGVSRGNFYRAILPLLPSFHLGRRHFIRVADLEHFIERKLAEVAAVTAA
jgi:hypothetical protein